MESGPSENDGGSRGYKFFHFDAVFGGNMAFPPLLVNPGSDTSMHSVEIFK